jgi:hypothetical protein
MLPRRRGLTTVPGLQIKGGSMPALIPTEIHATVTWLGYVPHRNAASIETRALDEMPLGWGAMKVSAIPE